MIYMAAYVAGKDELGAIRPLLSIAFVSVFFLLMLEILTMGVTQEEQDWTDPEERTAVQSRGTKGQAKRRRQ